MINEYILEATKYAFIAYLAYEFGHFKGAYDCMQMLQKWAEKEDAKEDAKEDGEIR